MHTLISRSTIVATVGALALSAPAAARPGSHSFQRTYPIASHLCAQVAAGHAPKRLRGDEAQVNQACAALQGSYSQAVTAALAAQAAFRSGAVTIHTQANQACRAARAAHNPAACRAARAQAQVQLQALRQTRRGAFAQYHASIEAARRAFWATIHSLRGGAGIAPDQPQPNSPVPTGGQ
jgi:hypothetical protein